MFKRTLTIVVLTGIVGCTRSPRFDLGSVSSYSRTPAVVENAIIRFAAEGPKGFSPPDHAIVGHWINRVGYGQVEPLNLIYSYDGTWTARDGSGDFITLQADGLRWLYEVARGPGHSVQGRSLRIYSIDGDQLLARFQRSTAGWEFWERVDKSSANKHLQPTPR
jgi:hypothetical protein